MSEPLISEVTARLLIGDASATQPKYRTTMGNVQIIAETEIASTFQTPFKNFPTYLLRELKLMASLNIFPGHITAKVAATESKNATL